MATSTNLSGFPTLQPAYIFKLNVGDMNPVGNLYSGSSFVHVTTPSGSIKTVPGFEPHIDAEIIFGSDSLYFDPDGSHARVNVQGLAKTTEGISIAFVHTGTVHLNEELKRIFDGGPDIQTTAFGQGSIVNTFKAGDAKYQDLVNSTWVGNNRFVVDNGKLTVESRVSKLVPSKDMD